MADTLCVGIDLGCDTLKLSYAYTKNSKLIYGKMEPEISVKQVAIPAVAYYDENKGWIFGTDVEMGEEKPFINIVKIKSLLSLLYPKAGSEWGKEVYPNESYFYKNDKFPKFYFPATNNSLEKFPALIKADRTFQAKGYTPQTVCEQFFLYVKNIIDKCVKELKSRRRMTFDRIEYSLVHPSYSGKKYVEELCEIIYKTLGSRPVKVMNSARALSMFATYRGAVSGDEGILLFDMGEETISVVKCFLNSNGRAVIESAADHSAPAKVGGNDVDFNIAAYIEDAIKDRETVGSPSAGEVGHIQEEGLQAKQYLFLKEIKKAKMMLSVPTLNEVFEGGVPVSVHRDLYIQRVLTREGLKSCIGITENDKVAKQVLNYIVTECKLNVNDDVTKIFLTGGLTETYGFVDYIKTQLAKKFKNRKPAIELCTFDDYVDDGDRLNIQSYEDSVYAPSVGAAIVALNNYDVSAGLTYSYGTFVVSRDSEKLLKIFADRGTAYDDQKIAEFSTGDLQIRGCLPEEYFSVRLSESSIKKRKCGDEVTYTSTPANVYLVIGERGSNYRKAAEKKFQLTGLFGANARIKCSYANKEVKRLSEDLIIREGIRISPHSSVAKPFIKNVTPSNVRAMATFIDGSMSFVKVSEIKVEFDGVKDIGGVVKN